MKTKNKTLLSSAVIAAGLLTFTPTYAQAPAPSGVLGPDQTLSFHTAGQVKSLCEGTGPNLDGCHVLLQGAFDAAEAVQNIDHVKSNAPVLFCPTASGLQAEQIRQQYLLVVSADPQLESQSFAAAFLGTLEKYFPCQQQPQQ